MDIEPERRTNIRQKCENIIPVGSIRKALLPPAPTIQGWGVALFHPRSLASLGEEFDSKKKDLFSNE